MSGEGKLNEFLSKVEDWITISNIDITKENSTAGIILNTSEIELRALSAEECLEKAYALYSHADYLQSVYNKQRIILDWADDSIWYIISPIVNQYGDKYTKWQEKYWNAVRENPLASEIIKIKTHTHARLSSLIEKADNAKRMGDILQNLSKRRT